MKEVFEQAEILTLTFDTEDIITTSNGNDLGGNNEMPLE